MADIIITKGELNDPAIDDVVNLQKSAQAQSGQRVDEIKTPFYYNPVFYYAIAASIGAVLIWAVFEPHYYREDLEHGKRDVIYDSVLMALIASYFSSYMLFGSVAAVIGLSIGAIYGLVNRNWEQVFKCGGISVGVSAGMTLITTLVSMIIYGLFGALADEFADKAIVRDRLLHHLFPYTGISFFIQMCGRGLAWSIVAMGAGTGLGVALKSKKLVLNGLVGGMVGGLLGGLVFDPISRFITPGIAGATLSRGVGIAAVGLLVGFFIGIFENLSKDAWFLMQKGPLTGKQFILFKSPMLIGSSPKSDVYLFKDPDIAPLHATVTKSGSRYLLKDEGSDKGTFVNGRRVDKYILQPNDTITIGEAVLKYAEKPRG